MNGMTSGWRVRPGRTEDMPVLRAMLYEAVCWHPERPRRPIGEMLAEPHLARYIQDWGRPGDMVVIAEDAATAQPIGAAWYRLFSAAEPGYGFVDAATPELAIAVTPGWRGRGVGSAMLAALLEAARATGFAALSLSVEPENELARSLYERHGFVQVGESDGAWTMRTDLTQRAAHPNSSSG